MNTGDRKNKKELRDSLAELSVTQRDFAAFIGVSFTTVNRWCLAHSRPDALPVPGYVGTVLHLLSLLPSIERAGIVGGYKAR